MFRRDLGGRADAFARPFLLDFAALTLAAIALAAIEGKTVLLRQATVFPWVVSSLTGFALLYALALRAGEALVDRGAFREPTGALWFIPLAHLVVAMTLWTFALHLPSRAFGDLWWCEATGLDFTRFQQTVRFLTALLGVNCALVIPPAVGLYFRSFVLARTGGGLPGLAGRPFIGSARPAMWALLAILAGLLFYVGRVSPDHLAWWKIRFDWRMRRDRVASVRSAQRFLELHADSRFRENALFFVGSKACPSAGRGGRDLPPGMPGRAVAALRAYLAEHPDRPYAPEATLLLAESLASLGETDEALLLADGFFHARPRHPLADDLLAFAVRLRRLDGRRAAADASRRTFDADFRDGLTWRCTVDEDVMEVVPTRELLDRPPAEPRP